MSDKRRRTAIGYDQALEWLILNDDIEWLDRPIAGEITPSVTACLVADIYGRDNDEVIVDLGKARKRLEREGAI